MAGDRVRTIDVMSSGSDLSFGKPRDLFKMPFTPFSPDIPLEVTPDGQRFLFVKAGIAEPGPTQINFVQGWQAK